MDDRRLVPWANFALTERAKAEERSLVPWTSVTNTESRSRGWGERKLVPASFTVAEGGNKGTEDRRLVPANFTVAEVSKKRNKDRKLMRATSPAVKTRGRVVPSPKNRKKLAAITYESPSAWFPQALPAPKRMRFTKEEGKKLLDFISEHKLHKYVGGNAIWVRIEKLKVVPFHSWHGLREHFNKKVRMHLERYGPTDDDRKAFKDYHDEIRRGKQHNVPPDVLLQLDQLVRDRT